MIISEEKDYFIYGCISTLFIESILLMAYGYCCDLKVYKMCLNKCKKDDNNITNDIDIDNSFRNLSDSPTSSEGGSTGYIDL